MKIQQLRYLIAVEQNSLSISLAAEKLFTSQPGVSKQIKQLEEELGVKLFNRNGKQLTHVTPEGRHILVRAKAIMREVENIKGLANEFRNDQTGELKLATTHTQARYILPNVIRQFRERYPQVSLQILQGRPDEIAEMAVSGEVDLAIATESIGDRDDLVTLPGYRWKHCVIVEKSHPLVGQELTSLDQIAEYPIVTYINGFTGRERLDHAFADANLTPNIVLSAVDSDVIKTYVRQDLGVGIIARMTYETESDTDLVALDTHSLFPVNATKIGFRRGKFLRGYIYDFLQTFAPHLSLLAVNNAAYTTVQSEVDEIFKGVELQLY
ncbi:MAG: HTH-type transcriptional regulator CysB [Pseudomonadota bacterium]